MIIVIDAYNFIKRISKHSFISDREKVAWMKRFQQYTQKRGNEVVLVFDAGPGYQEDLEEYTGLTVIYSGQMQIADDVIKRWLHQHVGQDILLVTSDREIRDVAHRLNIVSIQSHQFYDIFMQVMSQQDQYEQQVAQTIHKTTTNDSQGLDELMELGSRDLIQKSIEHDEIIVPRMSKSHTSSKVQRRLMKKIEKI